MQRRSSSTGAQRCIKTQQIQRYLYNASTRRTRRHSTAVAAAKDVKDYPPELLKQVMNYRYEVDTPEGQLAVSVLCSELLPKVADLLTDTFVDTKGIQPYRRYVRRNIHTYLEQHFKMPPAAVVLTAMLRTQVPVDSEDALMLEGLHDNSADGNSSSTTDSGSSSSSSRMDDTAAKLPTQGSTTSWQQPQQQQQLPRSSTSSSSSSSSQDGFGSIVRTALQHLSTGLGLQAVQQQQQRMKTVEQLVGVAEVSFREFTRSSYLTLNPPKKCAYLCNMAVGGDWRRKGIATHLITAVEDLCCLAGEFDVYLHLRLKDTESAGGLYNKAGFRVHQKDWPIICLLGQEPRYLMKKQLAVDRQLVGRVHLPQEQQLAVEAASDSVVVQQGAGVRQVAPAASPAA